MHWLLDGNTRKYTYSYDALSRLSSATFSGGRAAERYNTSYTYDKHGNITALQRYGNVSAGTYGLADNLTMSYNGNQLLHVSDAAATVALPESNDFKQGSSVNPSYAYDKNGNLTKDLNKKITNISYNSLHLPKQFTINGVVHQYTYAADGRKLKVMQGGTARDYAGSIIYENGSLKRILIEGGYIESGRIIITSMTILAMFVQWQAPVATPCSAITTIPSACLWQRPRTRLKTRSRISTTARV